MKANQLELSSLEQEAADENTPGDRLRELATINLELARLVASNPSAPPELLQELTYKFYCNGDPTGGSYQAICKAIASNPNTSQDMLNILICEFPLQVLNNSVLDLLLLENPSFLDQLCQTCYRYSTFQVDGLPFFFLKRAVCHPDIHVRIAVADNPATPQCFLEQLAQDREVDVRRNVAVNHNISPQTLEQLAKDSDLYVRLAVAKNPSTPTNTLKQLVQDFDYQICLAAAKNLVKQLEEERPF